MNISSISGKQYKIADHNAIQGTFSLKSNKIINDCEDVLSTVLRWENGSIKALNSRETNREHILGMLDLVWDFYDELLNICDVEELIIMILVHDLGEYRIGDIAKSEKGAEKKKKIQKKHEKRVAKVLINKIENQELREKCLDLLERYFEFSVQEEQPIKDLDTLYLITKFFDTAQGLEYGLETVFQENYDIKRDEVRNHICDNFQEMSNISSFLDATILMGTKTQYHLFTGEERENKKKEQQNNLRVETNEGIYEITNTILHRIKKKIKESYGLDVMSDFGKMINHFSDFSEKYKK